jgi:hypothetical protein
MTNQATFRNGYLQPETDPSHRDKVLVLTLAITSVLFAILQTCIL